MTGRPLTDQPAVDRIHAVFSDTHAGHILGLLRPGLGVYQDHPTYLGKSEWVPLEPNPLQRQLADWFEQDLEAVAKLAAGRPITVVHNGDPVQGTAYVREWVSTRPSDQISIAEHNLSLAFETLPNLQAFYFTIGTGSHEMGEGSATILLAKALSGRFPSVKTRIAQHWLFEIGGATFDMAHHGPGPGSRKWLDANNLGWYVNDIMQRHIDRDEKPPDVVVRSHFHTMAMATRHYRKKTTYFTTVGVLTPGYTGIDFYARQIGQSKSEVTVGLVAFEISSKGKVTGVEPIFRLLDTRTREIIA